MNIYDSLNKKIIFNCNLESGGIGDLTKFYMYLLDICINNKIKIHYLVNNTLIEKYLKLKYHKMYIQTDILKDLIYIKHINQIENIEPNKNYIIEPSILYETFSYDKIIYPLEDVFYFKKIVIENIPDIFKNNNFEYITIHLRLGDKYLETDKKFINCLDDVREYNEGKMFNFIARNHNKNILFLCDNNSYKLKIKNRYNNIIITNYDIGHTSLSNTTDLQVLNTLSEFYLLSSSKEIYKASDSGFSIMGSKFKNIPIYNIVKKN
jgi:hypothetical protein